MNFVSECTVKNGTGGLAERASWATEDVKGPVALDSVSSDQKKAFSIKLRLKVEFHGLCGFSPSCQT